MSSDVLKTYRPAERIGASGGTYRNDLDEGSGTAAEIVECGAGEGIRTLETLR